MRVEFNLKKLILFILREKERIDLRLHIWKIRQDRNILIPSSVNLKKSTIIECRFGGSIKIGQSTEVLENTLIITYGGHIKIGNNCSINPGTIIYGHGDTDIGNNVLIAGGCMIIPANHIFKKIDIPIQEQGLETAKIIIEDDVWIGHGCTILKGVRIGKGSVVAAGSVVNKTIDRYSIVGGVPAKVIKKRSTI